MTRKGIVGDVWRPDGESRRRNLREMTKETRHDGREEQATEPMRKGEESGAEENEQGGGCKRKTGSNGKWL